MLISQPTPNRDILHHRNTETGASRLVSSPQERPHRIETKLPHSVGYAVRSRGSRNCREAQVQHKHDFSFRQYPKVSRRTRILSADFDTTKNEAQRIGRTNTSRTPPRTPRRVRFKEDHEIVTVQVIDQKVRFEEDNNGIKVQIMGPLIKPSSEMTKREKRAIWWQASDFKAFAKDIATTCSSLSMSSENSPGSYASTLKKVYQQCSSKTTEDMILSNRDRLELVSWIRVGPCRRGLEQYSVPYLIVARRQNQEKAVRSVIEHQKRVGCVYGSNSKCDSLRSFLEKRTRTSTLFARLMAEADEAALEESIIASVPRII